MHLENIDHGEMFVAMEYFALILNRTFLVIVRHDALIGLKVRGLTSAGGRVDPTAVHGDLNDPRSYIVSRKLAKYEGKTLTQKFVKRANSANFWIEYDQIRKVYHDPKQKWGMAYYPHDGKVYIKTKAKRKELIILGQQSGNNIAESIRAKADIKK